MKSQIERLNRLLGEAKRSSLSDFQRAAIDVDEAIKEAYRKAHHLKAMWDEFEEIPPKQQKMYDRLMGLIGKLDKPGQDAHQLRMDLRRYK